jgi:hypothetical protein
MPTTLTIEIPDGDLQDVVQAICAITGTQPETPAAARAGLLRFIREKVMQLRRERAAVTEPNLK